MIHKDKETFNMSTLEVPLFELTCLSFSYWEKVIETLLDGSLHSAVHFPAKLTIV